MGISGLLGFLQPATKELHIKRYAGKKVAIDSYCWLHKGAYGCARELAMGQKASGFVKYCMKRLAMLKHYNVTPVVVFDGRNLPLKANEEASRRESRQRHREKGTAYLREGRGSKATEHFQKCIDITPELAHQLLVACRAAGIEVIVAPYEADSQLAHLALSRYVHAVITEDSDLLVYGCPRVVFKMNEFGVGQEIRIQRLLQGAQISPTVNFMSWTQANFRRMCILAGCDYLVSPPGVGIKTAFLQFKTQTDIRKVIEVLSAKGTRFPRNYAEDFDKAECTFLHQPIYDPVCARVRRLTPPSLPEESLQFAGSLDDHDRIVRMCQGHLHPSTLEPFDEDEYSAVPLGTANVEAKQARINDFFVNAPLQRTTSSPVSPYPSPTTPTGSSSGKSRDGSPQQQQQQQSRFFTRSPSPSFSPAPLPPPRGKVVAAQSLSGGMKGTSRSGPHGARAQGSVAAGIERNALMYAAQLSTGVKKGFKPPSAKPAGRKSPATATSATSSVTSRRTSKNSDHGENDDDDDDEENGDDEEDNESEPSLSSSSSNESPSPSQSQQETHKQHGTPLHGRRHALPMTPEANTLASPSYSYRPILTHSRRPGLGRPGIRSRPRVTSKFFSSPQQARAGERDSSVDATMMSKGASELAVKDGKAECDDERVSHPTKRPKSSPPALSASDELDAFSCPRLANEPGADRRLRHTRSCPAPLMKMGAVHGGDAVETPSPIVDATNTARKASASLSMTPSTDLSEFALDRRHRG